MALDPITLLGSIRELTEVINDRLRPRKPLSTVLGSGVTEKNLLTEGIQLETLVGDYNMAPFVNKDGVPSSITRKNFDAFTLETPCIKISAPLTDSDLLRQRSAGSLNFAADGVDVMQQAALKQIAEDMDEMLEMVALREEWMWSQLLTGSIAYEDADTNTKFSVDLKKPAGNTFTVSPLWSVMDNTPTVYEDIADAKGIVQNTYQGPAPTIALCGTDVAVALRRRMELGLITAIKLDSGISAGYADLSLQYNELGMSFLGRFGDIDFWQVSGSLTDDRGVTTPLIRADYIEFVPNSLVGKADRKKYYGRKRGITGTINGTAVGKMSARSYIDETKDVYMQEVQTRPLFWWRHPQWYVSMKVV